MLTFKNLLRQIEELYVEETIIKELCNPINESESLSSSEQQQQQQQQQQQHEQPSLKLYKKWKSIAETTKNLSESISEFKSLFDNIYSAATAETNESELTEAAEATTVEERSDSKLERLNLEDFQQSPSIETIQTSSSSKLFSPVGSQSFGEKKNLVNEEEMQKTEQQQQQQTSSETSTIKIPTVKSTTVRSASQTPIGHAQIQQRSSTVVFSQEGDKMNNKKDEIKFTSESNLKSLQISTAKPTGTNDDNKNTNLNGTTSSTNNELMTKSITELSNQMAHDVETHHKVNSSGLLAEPDEFLKCLEKLINSTNAVEKHLENIQKPNKEFVDFERQDLKLNAIKQTLESLAAALKTSLTHKSTIIEKSSRDVGKKITKSLSTLTSKHQAVVNMYKEKNAIYLKNYDKWIQFHKDYKNIDSWLDQTLIKVNDLKNSDLESSQALEIIKDFTNLTSYRLLLERTNLTGHEILFRSNEKEANALTTKLTALNKKWKDPINMLNEIKENYALKSLKQQQQQQKEQQKSSLLSQQQQQQQQNSKDLVTLEPFELLSKKLNEHIIWLRKYEQLIEKQIDPVDELEIERISLELKECEKDLPYRESIYNSDCQKYLNKLTKQTEIDAADKLSREVAQKFCFIKLNTQTKLQSLDACLESYRKFNDDLNAMLNWINNLHLDLVRNQQQQSQLKSSTSDQQLRSNSSSKASSPSPSSSSNQFTESNVNISQLYF